MKLTRHGAFSRFAVVLITVQAALLAAGCASTASSGHPIIAASPLVSVRLVLSSPTIVAGSSVSARLEIDNRTGHAIPVADCQWEVFQVLLQSPAYHPEPMWLNCLTEDSIPPGVSVRETRVTAVANACTSDGSVPGLVACAADGKPPTLPPGTYHAHVFAVTQLPSPPDVIVHVVAAAR